MDEKVNDQFYDTECRFCHWWKPKGVWDKIGKCLKLKKSREEDEWCMFFKPDSAQYTSRMTKKHRFGSRVGKWRDRYEGDREM